MPPTMRIGELATKVGVTTHVLRAWESRYGLLRPGRSAGGYRLYGWEDERRVREVVALRSAGVSAVEASRRVLEAERNGTSATAGLDLASHDSDAGGSANGAGASSRGRGATLHDPAAVAHEEDEDSPRSRHDPQVLVAQLLDAVSALDEDRAHAILDTSFLERSAESAITEVILPLFVRIGEQWEMGRFGIAQEHFATSLVRRRLGALSLTWGVGSGPIAVLACPPGEFHDIVLLSFGVLLGRSGWRVRYLGPDTPITSVAAAVRMIQADAIVMASRRPNGFRDHALALRELGRTQPLWLAGRGATPRVLEEIQVRSLGGDLVGAVMELTKTARANRRSSSAELAKGRSGMSAASTSTGAPAPAGVAGAARRPA